MLRIGLLGSDSSHAERFSELLNRSDHPNYLADADARVVAIWGEDAERTRQAAAHGRIETIVDRPGDLLGRVDAVFCITRHGGKHLELVRPYLEAKTPVFVDKPLATEPDDARAIVELARRHGTPFTSYSTVRFSADTQAFLAKAQTLGGVRAGVYTGPASRRNPYGGVIYYAIHSIELMLMVQGTGIEWVEAVEGPAVDAQDNGNMTAVCAWPDGATATLQLTVDAHYGFRAMALGKEGFHCTQIDISDCYREGLKRILPCLRGETDGPVPVEQMIEAVQVGKAIDRSLDEQARIYLNEL
ncbi:MAG TPA: Gfo/Idh/MocA family oxidoreductase [Caldilineaceae bacterium]|nr:Gfo/Idh/MocA family oxidoreductase [Caldilineaceae bacterium]